MLLIKCNCGCLMTIKSDVAITERASLFTCQNCNNSFALGSNLELQKFSQNGIDVNVIPDDAVINVSFDA